MKTKTKSCIDCGKDGTIERKRCAVCLKTYNNNRAKQNYNNLKKAGKKKNRYGVINCCVCKEEMIKNHPNQVAHGKCKVRNTVSYNNHKRDKTGMMIGRRIVVDLGIKIPNGIVVHHIDENPLNNSFKNLMIISVKNHAKLHSFLKEQWVINKGIYGEKLDSVWRKILIKLNFIWIKQHNIKIVFLEKSSSFKGVELEKDNLYMIK